MKLALLGLLLAGALGCYGRIDDQAGAAPPRIDRSDFGLAASQPAVLVFSAAWCKPCRHEVPLFNTLQGLYLGRVQVMGYLVEGEERGAAPDPRAAAAFADGHGVRPEFPLTLDGGWRRFDKLLPPNGRTLPLVAFITADGDVLSLAQHSLELHSELIPLTEALIAGTPPPSIAPPAVDTASRWVPVQEWTLEAEHAEGTPAFNAMESGWEQGLAQQGFTSGEMPFEKGSLRLQSSAGGREWVAQGEWTTPTGCELRVTYREDGSFAGSIGVCR